MSQGGLIDVRAINPPPRVLSACECSLVGGRAPAAEPPASPAQQQLQQIPQPSPTPPVHPPPLQSRPPPPQTSDVPTSVSSAGSAGSAGGTGGAVLQPCSMSCGRGAVPSLSCVACLCLYHPACVGLRAHPPNTATFLCKNCRKSSSPPLLEPPALVHKSGVPPPRRPAPVPTRPHRRVLLRMKAAGSVEGERVWSVAPAAPATGVPSPAATATPPAPAPAPTATPPPTPTWRGAAPQSLAVLNGRRFVVVPRSLVQAATHT